MAPAGYIDEPTRKKLEQVGAAARKAVAARDQAIFEAVEAGIALRTVGAAVGLTHERVRTIANRVRDEQAGRPARKDPMHYPADPSDPAEWKP